MAAKVLSATVVYQPGLAMARVAGVEYDLSVSGWRTTARILTWPSKKALTSRWNMITLEVDLQVFDNTTRSGEIVL